MHSISQRRTQWQEMHPVGWLGNIRVATAQGKQGKQGI